MEETGRDWDDFFPSPNDTTAPEYLKKRGGGHRK
jgi:hypothetical protein